MLVFFFNPEFYSISGDTLTLVGTSHYLKTGETSKFVREVQVKRNGTYMLNRVYHKVSDLGKEFGAIEVPFEAIKFMAGLINEG